MSLRHPGRDTGLSDHDGASPDRVRLLPVRVDGLPVCVTPARRTRLLRSLHARGVVVIVITRNYAVRFQLACGNASSRSVFVGILGLNVRHD